MANVLRTLACLVAATTALYMVSWTSTSAAQPTVYGKNLVRAYDVPADTLTKFVRFNAKAPAATGIAPDTENWSGEAISAPPSGNPYTIVVRTNGVAVTDGEVSARWQPGWNIDGTVRIAATPHVRRDGVRAGDRVELVSASSPLSFKEERQVVPVVGFAGARNFKFDSVQVEVWSGVGKPTFAQLVFSWSPLLVGLVFLGLFLWWRRG